MLKNCEQCGREFVARRSTAKWCSNVCRVRAQRQGRPVRHEPRDVPAYDAPDVKLYMTVDEIAEVVQNAHRATDDMGRASRHARGELGGKLRRCAEGFADALEREGL